MKLNIESGRDFMISYTQAHIKSNQIRFNKIYLFKLANTNAFKVVCLSQVILKICLIFQAFKICHGYSMHLVR